MKKILFTVLLLSIICLASAQNVLVLENLTRGKSYKFFTGEGISVITKGNPQKVSGHISEIRDSSIVISNNYVYNLGEIQVVYKDRLGVQIVATLLAGFGAMFFTLDVVNNVINNDHPTFKSNVAIISASSAAAGGILWIFNQRKCPIAKDKWRLKIIEQVHVKTR
jgi:hypothetical protein